MKKKLSYWESRKLQYEQANFAKSEEFLSWLNKEYDTAFNEIHRDIYKHLTRIAEDNGMSVSEAKKFLNADELKEFRMDLKTFTEKATGSISKETETMLNNVSNRIRISKLQAMEVQIKSQIDKLMNIEQKSLFEHLGKTYKDNFYHMTYELQKITGYDFIQEINTKKLNAILNKPWAPDEKNFSERIWGKNTKVVNELHKELLQNIVRGRSPDEAIKSIAKKLDVSKRNASRLVYTETASISAMADEESYIESGLEEFEVLATLDLKTSDICRTMDGKVFSMKDYKIGITAPPFHVSCRSTTVPYFRDSSEDETRAMRNPITGKSEVVRNMNYDEWYKKYVVSNPEASRKETMYKNRFQDRKQYENYKDILGKNMPYNFDGFKDLKYNNSKKWDMFKSYKNSISTGELTALADFKLYEEIDRNIDRKIVGQVTSNGMMVKSKSKHFISRVIGSLEQKRSGVEISDIVEALSNPEKIHPIRGIKKKSQRFDTVKCRVSINPDTGVLIQVNPL